MAAIFAIPWPFHLRLSVPAEHLSGVRYALNLQSTHPTAVCRFFCVLIFDRLPRSAPSAADGSLLNRIFVPWLALLCFLAVPDFARPQATLSPVSAFPVAAPELPAIHRDALPQLPFSVVGPRGAVLGQQDGTSEVWLFPWKIFSNLRLSVSMQDYAVPIEVNPHAASVDVQPDETTITYSHANFTIRQIMLAPKSGDPGALIFFSFAAVRPMDVTFSLHPDMQRMWPAESPDRPSPEWVPSPDGSGFYILHLNFPDHAAALALPTAEPGILPPYQERAAVWPLQFVLHFDPKKDAGKLYPLLMTFANSGDATTKSAFAASLAQLDAQAQSIFTANRTYYRDFLAQHTSIDTPDAHLNDAFAWAETAIDQLRVETPIGSGHQALTAGFYGSGDAARPGFGWFFGRDALWTLYAVDSYGDFGTTKQEIQFLIDHQRADGKIMHEWSQTANLVDWPALPYEWAAADSTPLFIMAVNDYLYVSGDSAFITSIWPSLERAWTFETSHDSDGDGIYNNSEGSGWVESWIPSMPRQEIYLAALDEQASLAFAHLADAAGHADLASAASRRARRIAPLIEQEYYLPDQQNYAFSWNSGQRDATATIFPSVAWWDGDFQLAHPESMLQRWATSEFSTDWGTRDLSDRTSFYDPISYHQGSVWPLFTGWVSLAEYRTGHPLSGYAHLMQNADLTWPQDPGDVTELLSGQFYQVLGRSTAHQLWSSAMVVSPVLRGLFGLEWDDAAHTLSVTPHLPATWDRAAIRRVPFGGRTLDLSFRREGRDLLVQASDASVHLASESPGATVKDGVLRIPLSAIEAAITEELPAPGAETHQLKVLADDATDRSLTLKLAAPGGTTQTLSIRENSALPHLAAHDAQLGDPANGLRTLTVQFPAALGYTEKTVTLSW
jgi:glycogen debranching enzyme